MKLLESYTTWTGLLYLMVLILLVFWTIRLLSLFIERRGKKNLINRRIQRTLKKFLVIFPMVAAAVLLMGFLSVNYIIHGILVLVITIFALPHIRNYISGVFFKLNPITDIGASIKSGEFEGELDEFLLLGIIINTVAGERFVQYATLENAGFTIKSNKNKDLRQTLYLRTTLSRNKILDLLFENPILDFNEKPQIKEEVIKGQYILKYTLENGVISEDLIAFLHDQNIVVHKTDKP